jgi:hypothetical protein
LYDPNLGTRPVRASSRLWKYCEEKGTTKRRLPFFWMVVLVESTNDCCGAEQA